MISESNNGYSEVWTSQQLIVDNPFIVNYYIITAAGIITIIIAMVIILTIS